MSKKLCALLLLVASSAYAMEGVGSESPAASSETPVVSSAPVESESSSGSESAGRLVFLGNVLNGAKFVSTFGKPDEDSWASRLQKSEGAFSFDISRDSSKVKMVPPVFYTHRAAFVVAATAALYAVTKRVGGAVVRRVKARRKAAAESRVA